MKTKIDLIRDYHGNGSPFDQCSSHLDNCLSILGLFIPKGTPCINRGTWPEGAPDDEHSLFLISVPMESGMEYMLLVHKEWIEE